jgi:hypothetical protein
MKLEKELDQFTFAFAGREPIRTILLTSTAHLDGGEARRKFHFQQSRYFTGRDLVPGRVSDASAWVHGDLRSPP